MAKNTPAPSAPTAAQAPTQPPAVQPRAAVVDQGLGGVYRIVDGHRELVERTKPNKGE